MELIDYYKKSEKYSTIALNTFYVNVKNLQRGKPEEPVH